MTSYQGEEIFADNKSESHPNISNSIDKIPSKIASEFNFSKSTNKDRVTSLENLNTDKIEKSIIIPINIPPYRLREGNNQSIQLNSTKKVEDIIGINLDFKWNSLNNQKIEGQKLKNLPITTCMKKNIYDYQSKNNLNSEISSNYKEMEIDNVFSELLNKVKEKKDKNVEPRRLSEFSFNNFINKGPLKFFNLVINRKIPENQCSKAFLPNKKYGCLSRSSQPSIISNLSHRDLINKKIIDEKNKLMKNEYNYKLIEKCNRSDEGDEEMQSVNKNSVYNSEPEMHQNSQNYPDNIECINGVTNANLEKTLNTFYEDFKKNAPISLDKTRDYKHKSNDEMKKLILHLKNEVQIPNSVLECKSDKVIEQTNLNKNNLLNASGNSSTDIGKNPLQSSEIASKINNLNDSLSIETTNTNSHNSPANTAFYNFNNKPIINMNILNIDRKEQEFLKKKRTLDLNEKETININKKSSRFNSYSSEEYKEKKMNENPNLIELGKQKRKIPDTKLSNFKYELSNNGINTCAVQHMFNQCLSKNAASGLNSSYSKNLNDFYEKEISPYVKTNIYSKLSSENKNQEFHDITGDFSSKENKRNEYDNEKIPHIKETPDCKLFKNNEFNPNYKVESSLNVNVNLVTYPDYFRNSNNDDKVSLNKNASINVSNSSSNYSQKIQKVYSSASYPATNISNFANININNTLPQILINPSTNINNANTNNSLKVDCFTKKENEMKNDSIRNFNFDNKASKENNFDDKYKRDQNLKKGNCQKDVLIETSVDINAFKNLLKQNRITFQEIHHELNYLLKFNLEKTNSCFEITIDNNNTKILTLINYDTKIGQKVIEIKNMNSDTNEVINFNFNKIKALLNE